jgi:hypothetical protein
MSNILKGFLAFAFALAETMPRERVSEGKPELQSAVQWSGVENFNGMVITVALRIP